MIQKVKGTVGAVVALVRAWSNPFAVIRDIEAIEHQNRSLGK